MKVKLLSLAAHHGDAQSVTYLLKDAHIAVPQRPSGSHPVVLAASCGHLVVVQELLDCVPDVSANGALLRRSLLAACQQGHMDVVRLLVHRYGADVQDCNSHNQEFAVISKLPLYAAAQAGNTEIAHFLLEHGAALSSYALIDHSTFSKDLLRRRLQGSNQSSGDQAVTVCWGGLQLPWLELDWFLDVSSRIVHLDLSSNRLAALPSVVPWGLIRLQTLDLSNNKLKELPAANNSQDVICSSLQQIDLGQNQLESLPTGLLHLTNLTRLCTATNHLTVLFHIPADVNWIGLRKLEELDLSHNSLSVLPGSIMHCLKSLRNLNVSSNQLLSFPEPWTCPLTHCRASSNLMASLPGSISPYWRAELQEVDFSDNRLTELPSYLFQLEALTAMKLSGNLITALPAASSWKCTQLKSLDLSKNQLGRSDVGHKSRRMAFLSAWSRREADPVNPVEFPRILRNSLEVLFLNDNQLDCVPPSLCGLHSLTELYLSSNPGIRELPVELGQLSNLWQLDIEDLSITNVPQEVQVEGPASVLAFLRAQNRKAEPCRQLKMLVVGPARQGKTALIQALLGGKVSPFSHAEHSVTTFTWETERDGPGKNNKDLLEFSVWDLGGAASTSTVNQCFFTDKSLYVVVWNLALGEEAVAHLQTWLLNIEARAPNSTVLVVGTHLDLVDTKFRMERLATLRAHVLALCRSPSGARAAGYPDVSLKNLHEVSCKTSEGVSGLKTLIQQVALLMKDSSLLWGRKLVDRLIPKSYLVLQKAVREEKQRREADGQVQYLSEAQLDAIMKQNSDSDITDYEDRQTAISFLIETGTVLHFPDTSRGLCTLYFLCPVWLSDCLFKLFHSVTKNGMIGAEDLRKLLEEMGFTPHTEEQFIQFLAKFEIALPVANSCYLLPHLLPPKPAMDLQRFQQQTNNTLQRLFKMSFIPAGFWDRFIARMLISLTDMDVQSADPSNKYHRSSTIYSFAAGRQRSRCSTFRVRRNHTIYWKEGLLVTFSGGYLSVESSYVNWKKTKSGGIKIICQSENRDFSAMAFVTDHVTALIEQWFPALTGTESDGSLLVEQYVPCSLCVSPCQEKGVKHQAVRPSQVEELGGQEEPVHYFNIEDCVLAAVEGDHITCPRHPEKPVPLQELVPELFMTDFPSRLFLDKAKLDFCEDDAHILGQGGSGTTIYRAKYQGQPVAVKRFHFKKDQRQTVSATDTMLRHLQSANACRSFSEFRQEASMLHSLQHPCIVSMLGISIHPLCFALQLAPLGSLNTVLEENHLGCGFMPLGHMLTFKMAYQVAAGLSYLHRKRVIFCDLKSDNILVWSLQALDPVNIRLSDYGISRQSYHDGALGVEGTPGYQAPEVKPGIVYDEKVDMFSYGMVLYELLSGNRPALGQHQRQIAKKLSKGIRPVLGNPEQVQFQSLQSLMTECWDNRPEKRPVASQCVQRMQDPGFACLQYLLTCGSHSQLFLSLHQGSSAVFWSGDGEERNYSVVNVEKGQVEVNRMSCPGSRISSQIRIQSCLWMATEEQKVFIYSLKDMCPLSRPQKQLFVPAVITCFCHVPDGEQNLAQVFGGMSDGLLVVYSLLDDLPLEGETYLCCHTLNKTSFGLTDSDPRQMSYPVGAMVLVSRGSQLWFSNGPGVLVLDTGSLQAVQRLEPYQSPSSVVSMTTSFSLWGEEAVWMLDDHTNQLLLYHAASYQLCATYWCGDSSPLQGGFTVERPPEGASAPATGPSRTHPEELEQRTEEMKLIVHAETGTQMIRDSLSEYCSIFSSCSSEQQDSYCNQEVWDFVPPQSSLSPAEPAAAQLPAFTVLLVNGTLWIPRRGGDVLVIEMQSDTNHLRGRVKAVLSPPTDSSLGVLKDAALVSKHAVVCGFQKENQDWTLVVWRSWGPHELDIFYRTSEELSRLEFSRRRRK
ncbi:leucine-rich repeat serine/threonine-protein kinase 1 isoform X3 [Oryzias melastigma]|uniref:leucine-rich repeat serine/threonine-protein kinase 1 isoform X2 n=1 Tax=Oryzias melastigma TaxID=30732 RepID=UPI000CF7F1DF|nr:leucine-rich repeat serine/threonine-protein kinase 1 isoform X2 [Oryzias melastigma]XP_024117549.1 leucine-rich repeat serine/threonine-protein kinase 1 isoform X3 [Oryzias melastigma]